MRLFFKIPLINNIQKNSCILLALFVLSTLNLYAQVNYKPSSGYSGIITDSKDYLERFRPSESTSNISFLLLGATSLLGPTLVFENGNTYLGFSKGVSVSKAGYGRFTLDYTHVFKNENQNQFRLSYDYDFPVFGSDFIVLIASAGVGYFNDTKNNGWLAQGSTGGLILIDDNIVYYPFIRYRHTFIPKNNKSDIDDISLSSAVIFYF
ncbi:hypothetical protein FBQ84_03345 [Ignavibacteria bacterium CHB1]|nr:MAG: hypothetical protein EDM69_03110 [Chlorobiota bacterium]MBV6398414.1 hypothetical protein [Ignavibacteria bacterium]MCC6885994.1 hypothetical protein [Ignavibacteriales bacterium]MCE7952756.1 hypothetical protein [Chlorobi bacterium CHB7]MDL1886866.1 hypothetical protein [Ignavibacteria bacterium CHB1]RIK50389.1 MAG: hypothetical protein DCC60_00895 [Ignavibacteriota bacterium]